MPGGAGDTVRELRQWLESHGLGAWSDALASEGVEVRDLSHLTPEDLAELGMPLGPRRRLLSAAAESTTAPRPIDGLSGAERRVLTVAFFDLVGSTALSDRLDTETLRDIISRYQELVTRLVTGHGGHVAKYLGDGTLAYFGWPTASTNQAVDAVRAAKHVVRDVPSIQVSGVEAELSGRVGIATGEIIIGDIAGEKDAIVGRTANLAARLEGQAPSGGVAIEAQTASLTGRRFELESAGAVELKGLEEAVEIFIVGEERIDLTRFAGATSSIDLSPIVGRTEERAALAEAWQRSTHGAGEVCVISGEAGAGKSRLVHDLVDEADKTAQVLTLQCAPEWTSAPLRPVVQWVETSSGCAVGTGVEERVALVAAHLSDLGLEADDIEFFLRFLSSRSADADQPVDAVAAHDRLLSALAQALVLGDGGPRLLTLEDAHWADPTTLKLFRRIAKVVQDHSVMLVLTHRSGWSPPKLRTKALHTLELSAMPPDAIGAIALSVDSAVEDDLDEIVEQCGGNPFFAREYALFLRWRRKTGDAAVPFTLATSLLGRLDELGPAKRLAQVASILGRRFDRDLLATMIDINLSEASTFLQPLLDAHVVALGGSEGSYDFVHALVRDAAYDSLLAADRRVLHGRAADAGAGSFRLPPQVLAMHLSCAERWPDAVAAWRGAGEQALGAGASTEAVENLSSALVDLENCPEHVHRNGAERLELLLQLAPATMVVRGYASETARVHYREAVELARGLNDAASQFVAVWGGYYTTEIRADFHQSESDIDELLAVEPDTLPHDLSIQIDHAATTYFGAVGPVERAAHHAKRMVDSYDADLHCGHRHLFGAHDPGVCGTGQLGMYELYLARPGVGRELGRSAIELGQELGHPPSTAIGMMLDAFINTTGEYEDAVDAVDRAVDHCRRHDVSAVGMTVDFFRRHLIEDPEARHAALFGRLEPMRTHEVLGLFVPQFAGFAAQAAMQVDQPQWALDVLNYAQLVIDRTAQRTTGPTILRLRALALAALGDVEAADTAFGEAMSAALDLTYQWERVLAARDWIPHLRDRGKHEQADAVLSSVDDVIDWSSNNPVIAELQALRKNECSVSSATRTSSHPRN